MANRPSRRSVLKAAGAALALPAITRTPAFAATRAVEISKPRFEGPGTPKIALELGAQTTGTTDQAAASQRVRQLGVTHLLGGLGQIPWTEARLRTLLDGHKANGLTMACLMISGFNNAIYNRPGKDEAIDNVIQSVRAAGKAGLPVVEYNWYAHRAMEGYFGEVGRANSGWTGFDYERMKGLEPLPNEGAHTAAEMWANITYFLKAVVPEAERAGVRLALHPNDPPAPISRGSEQIMGSIDGWKKLVSIVNSPSNGITFDCGVTREMGGDPAETCKYFASRDRINHVHFRNVKVQKPNERYTEVFIDEGDNDMFSVMTELVKAKYARLIYPEHARGVDYDTSMPNFRSQYPGGGGYAGYAFNVGYTRAMMQAALLA